MNEMTAYISALEKCERHIRNLETERDAYRDVLEMARNGIKWYIDNAPEASGCDDEALTQINEVLAKYAPVEDPIEPARRRT